MSGASGRGFHNILFYSASRDHVVQSTLIGGPLSQPWKTKDERDCLLQIVGGNHPNDVPKIHDCRCETASTETETKNDNYIRQDNQNPKLSQHTLYTWGGALSFRILWDPCRRDSGVRLAAGLWFLPKRQSWASKD